MNKHNILLASLILLQAAIIIIAVFTLLQTNPVVALILIAVSTVTGLVAGYFTVCCHNTVRSFREGKKKEHILFSEMVGHVGELENKITELSKTASSPGEEVGGKADEAKKKIEQMKDTMETYKKELVKYLTPINKVFYMKENNFTVSERMNNIIGALISSIKSTVNDMNHQSETLTLTFEAFDITTLTMEKVDSIIQHASRLAEDLTAQTTKGQNAVITTRDSMGEILDFSEKMATIITTIVDISDKTNILAINAAIESTRAGKEGKGFAVIAQEIRALANTTREASIEIKTIIESIIEKIEKQAELYELVHNIFLEISNYIQKTSSLNKEIYKISRKNVIQGKEIQTAVNMLKSIADKIISASNKELFEANEIMTIMKAIEKLFAQDYNFEKFLSDLSSN
ncbi:MAG: hypothetical protein JW881_07075 [Spirochaetales bacterium]|nr:hypothetical protein [Spirochaetales bacterium]